MARRRRKRQDEKRNEFAGHWKEQIQAGLKYREKYSTYKSWKDLRSSYRGEWKEEVLGVNRTFSFGRTLQPRVYFHSPRVTVTATHPDYVANARVIEAVDNQLIRETMLKRTMKTSILDAYLAGTGPIKLGYDSEYGYSPDMAVGEDGETATQEGTKDVRRIEYKSYIKPGMPWAAADRPENVVVPPGYKYAEDVPWIAHRILRPLEDIQQDQKYANTELLKGGMIAELDPKAKRTDPYLRDMKIKYAELWEIRDYRDGQIHTICEEQILLSDVDVLQIESLPWEFLIFNEDPEYFWGIPDAKMIEQQQMELNDTRTQAKHHRAITLLKFLAMKGVMDEEAINKFLAGDVGPYVEVDAESLAAAIMILQPHMPPDLSNWSQEVKNDMRETLGFNENTLSAFKGGTPPTATESMSVSSAFDIRENERKDIVADVFTNIIRKWNQMIFTFWDKERVIEIVGPQGASEWIQYTGDQIKGEYIYKVDPDSGFPVTRMARMQLSQQLLSIFGGDKQVNQSKLKEQVLQQFEWMFPGISQALIWLPEDLQQALAALRQPSPMGGGQGNMPTGNRGGGRRGAGPESPIPFEQYQKRGGGEGAAV